MTCRWCDKPVDLPLGDECRACQDRLNRQRPYRTPVAYKRGELQTLSSYYKGCELVMKEDGRPVVKLEWDHTTTARNVREHLQMFFKHAGRIQIARLGGLRGQK